MADREDRGNTAQALDKLYQAPLAEFTAARNELAKTAAPAEARAIRALPKPNVPAWAVNQLYWRERRTYDALVRASERLRAAHARSLGGKKPDLAVLELQHGAAVKAAAESIRGMLGRMGDPATPATMKAVIDTLQALPGGGPPGRLSRPLAPLGFGALGALMKGAATPKMLAEVVAFAPPKPAKPTVNEREVAERRAREDAATRLRELRAQSTRIARELSATRVALQRAEREQSALEAKLQKTTADVARHRSDIGRLERDAHARDQERERLENLFHMKP